MTSVVDISAPDYNVSFRAARAHLTEVVTQCQDVQTQWRAHGDREHGHTHTHARTNPPPHTHTHTPPQREHTHTPHDPPTHAPTHTHTHTHYRISSSCSNTYHYNLISPPLLLIPVLFSSLLLSPHFFMSCHHLSSSQPSPAGTVRRLMAGVVCT